MVADTYSSILGFLIQGTGNNNNSWGDNCNNDVFAVLEAAIAKRKANTGLTGGTLDLDDTLPPAGASSAIEHIQHFAGSLGSDQIVLVPNVSKVWLVNNALTLNGYTLKFKTASGSASSAIPVGWCFVWCDGSDVIYVGLSTSSRDTQLVAPAGSLSAPGLAWNGQTATGARNAGYAAGTLANNPFTTTNASATVTVAHTSHGLTATTDFVYLSGASAVGGITIDGLYQVASTPDANSYTITHSANATSNASGGGASVAYKYMKAASGGTASAVTANGADVAHASPFGWLFFGRGYFSSDLIVGGATKIVGALTGAAATFTGLLTGAAATLSGILTLSSTSHMVLPSGTTGERPSSQVAARFRFNTTTGRVEYDTGSAWVTVDTPNTRGRIDGCILSNGTDAVNDINVGTGSCRDSTNAVDINISTAMGKQLDANWAPGGTTGTPLGMRNSAAGIANGTYHIFAASKADGTADIYAYAGVAGTPPVIATVLTALNAEANKTGADYLYARLIGSIVRVSGSIVLFTQIGDYFRLKTPALDINTSSLSTTATTFTLVTPPVGVSVLAKMNLVTSAVGATSVYVRHPDDTDSAASISSAPLASVRGFSSTQGVSIGDIWTDTSAQVAAVADAAGTTLKASVIGYLHPRGKDA